MITCAFEDGYEAKLRHVTVDCIVVKGSEVLLGKRAEKLLEGGKWCLPGGFMDRDETCEQTAVREVLEESGWTIANLRLLRIKDYPDRPGEDRQNVSFVYIADAVEKIGKHDWETEELRWFDLNALPPEEEIAFDHASDIKLYLKYLTHPFTLPYMGKADIA